MMIVIDLVDHKLGLFDMYLWLEIFPSISDLLLSQRGHQLTPLNIYPALRCLTKQKYRGICN